MVKEGIVLKQIVQNEKDAMVSILTQDGIITFYAKGVLKITSKNSYALSQFTYSKFDLFEGSQGGLSLKEATIIKSYANITKNFSCLASLCYMAEITLKCIDEIDARYLYGYFKRSLELIDTGFDSFTLLNIYLARTLSEAGFGLCVDSCSNCKTRESIVGISFIEGGFVCKNCHTNDMVDFEKLDERNLKIYRYLFKVKPDQIDHVEFEKEENRRFFKNLHSYLLDQTGAKITTYELAKNL